VLLGACLAASPAAGPARAIDLALPGNARETAAASSDPDSYALPLGAYADGELPVLVTEGHVTRQAWRIQAQGITTLQLLAPLRDQLAAAGYETLFECDAATCGGFDFRFGIEVFPEPDMHVDLYDFRFLSTRASGGDGHAPSYAALLVSRTANAGYVQVVQVTPPGGTAPKTTRTAAPATSAADTPTPTPAAEGDGAALTLVQRLETRGHAVLRDLTFETGSSDLGQGRFASLATLAAFLLADPARRVALVGHTDAVGSLDGNIALSKRRAASVVERLATLHAVPRAQMTAEGMGYLSPITTNLTAEGREANRRVEVVLLNTE
jgi:OOP family OmpA-OmpF porin